MSEAPATEPPRLAVGVLAALHALVFGAAAAVLPYDDASAFAWTAGALALAHGACVVSAAFVPSHLAKLWRISSGLALGMLLLWGYWSASAGSYLIGLYGSLGQGLAGAAAAAFAPVVLFTLPFGVWGWLATRGAMGPGQTSSKAKAAGSAGLALLMAAGMGTAHASSQAHPKPTPDTSVEAIEKALVDFDELALGNGGARVYVHHGFECEETIESTRLATALVAFQDQRDPQGRSSTGRCVQAPPHELFARINEILKSEGRQAVTKLDLVTGVQPIVARHALIDGLKLRPGLDGVCQGARCLAPWQLVAHDQFTRFVPISFIADLRVGVDPGHLLAAIFPGRKADEGGEMSELQRIETASFVVSRRGEVQALRRGHPLPGARPLEPEQLDAAVRAAGEYIVKSQLPKGRFRYKYDPYSGKKDDKGFNLPRQAGTTFALCQHGPRDDRTKAAISKSLRLMSRYARKHDDRHFLTKKKKAKRAALGETALPLIAFAACRERVGRRYDELMGGMARALLSVQDDRGVFATWFDRKKDAPIEGPETLFAEGQAVMALSMLEKIVAEDERAAELWPEQGRLQQSVERAMNHYAYDYWTHALAQFFWIEENWHCLAAVASLEHHRHDGYERMCLDYNRYKMRLALDAESRVAAEFEGAYGFGNVIAPHNTATAGLGEGLAAAIEIANARGEDSAAMRDAMRGVQRFLLTQQWRGDESFAHRPRPSAEGGWSESMVSPTIRIDYVQHAMAALASGRAAIERAEKSSPL